MCIMIVTHSCLDCEVEVGLVVKRPCVYCVTLPSPTYCFYWSLCLAASIPQRDVKGLGMSICFRVLSASCVGALV